MHRRQLEIDRTRTALALHLRSCSNSQSYFYTINGDYRHPFSLANLCGVDNHQQWRALLVSADLAMVYESGRRKNKMKIKTDEWDNFITYHDLSGVVERVEPTGFDAWLRFNGKASSITQFHQLRIGNKSSTSPNKIGDQIDKSTMLMKPPMISARRLESWQNTLRNSTEFDTLDHLLSLDDIGDKHPATDHADSSNNNKTIDSRDDNTTVPSGDDESPKKRQRTLSSSETNTVSPDKNTSVSEFPILTKLLGGIIDCNNKDTLGKVNEVALEIIQLLGNGTELTVRHQTLTVYILHILSRKMLCVVSLN